MGSFAPGTVGAVAAEADLLLFLVVGALAGAHCLGMCGPLVSTYADRVTASRDSHRRLTLYDVRQHGLFNLGRTVGYAAIGAGLGLLGSLVVGAAGTVDAVATPVRAVMGLVVGAFIIGAGLRYLTGGTTTTLDRVPGLGRAFRRVSALLSSRVDRLAGSPGIAALGVVHALLPCPILYPAYLYAFALGDPLRGGLALGLLGLGTIPTLLAYGLAFGTLSVGHRRTIHRGMGAAFLVLGYLPLAHGLMLLGVPLPHPQVPFYQPL